MKETVGELKLVIEEITEDGEKYYLATCWDLPWFLAEGNNKEEVIMDALTVVNHFTHLGRNKWRFFPNWVVVLLAAALGLLFYQFISVSNELEMVSVAYISIDNPTFTIGASVYCQWLTGTVGAQTESSLLVNGVFQDKRICEEIYYDN